MPRNVPFETVVADTFGAIELAPDFDSIHINNTSGYYYAALQDRSGLNDVFIAETPDYGHEHTRPLGPPTHNGLFTFRGLIRHESGSFLFKYGPAAPLDQIGAGPERRRVEVTVNSSPHAINVAQTVIGREPGVSAMKLVRKRNKGDIRAGQYVSGFKRHEVAVADLSHPFLAEHDIRPADHVIGWITTSPEYCARIASRAQTLTRRFGPLMYMCRPFRPRSIDTFAESLDSLADFNRPIFVAVSDVAKAGNHSGEPAHELSSMVFNVEDAFGSRSIYAEYVSRKFAMFKSLGIIATHYPEKHAPVVMRAISAHIAAYTAGLLIKLEDVRPINPGSLEQASRIDALKSVISAYGSVEAPSGALLTAA